MITKSRFRKFTHSVLAESGDSIAALQATCDAGVTKSEEM